MRRRARARFRLTLPAAFAAATFCMAAAAPARAGDVSVGAITPGGDVRISGDAAANDFTVTQNADGTVTVTPGAGTTVNGKNQPFTTGKAVTGDIKIRPGGGDDTVVVDGVKPGDDLDIQDDTGTNSIKVKNAKVKDKLKIRNSKGSIEIEDSSWGRRDVDKGKGTVKPANLNGRGGAGSVGTPPTSGGGKPDDHSQAPREAQQQGLPTANPGQRGIIRPELPSGQSGYGWKGKSKY